jgi:N-acetylglutamate synthase-like GNAT family acetyltransferase
MNSKTKLFKNKVVCITGSSRGVGRKLVEYFESYLKDQGLSKLYLKVNEVILKGSH